MTELLTAAQMRAIEQAAIESGEVTGLELMERAGAGVVEAILEEWPDMANSPQKAVVLCGPGNNGGDGFVVARLLKARGWAVEVFLYGDVEKLPPDAKVNAERWLEVGEIVALSGQASEFSFDDPQRTDVFVDALFGTGLSRPFLSLPSLRFSLNTAGAIASQEDHHPYGVKVVSVDIGSGFCSDSGAYLGSIDSIDPIFSTLTVSFHRPKIGHFLGGVVVHCAKLRVIDIGLERSQKVFSPKTDIESCKLIRVRTY